MAKHKEAHAIANDPDQSGNAIAIIPPPSLLAVSGTDDEIAGAFGSAITGPRADAKSVPIIQIDHEAGEFLLSGNSMGNAIHGYPCHFFQARAWWPKPPGKGETNPPVCWSSDMVKPHLSIIGKDRQSESCTTCDKAQFGSSPAGTKGQACRTSTFLFLVNPAFGSPPIAALILPPSSIRPLLGGGRAPGYLQGAKHFRDPKTGRAAQYHELVWTKWTLESGGDKHYVIAPVAESVCPTADEARALGGLRNKFMDMMEAMRGSNAVVALDPNEGN